MGGQVNRESHEIWREVTDICHDENLDGLKTFVRDNNLRLDECFINRTSDSVLSILVKGRVSFVI
jgi:hypothetical protein